MGVRDGAIVREVPERVQLELVSVDPPLVYDGTTIIATVRLKNIGDQPILVPWTTPPVEPDTDPKTGAKSWERATIHLTLGIREDRRRSSYLKGEANLTAAPSNRPQQVELLSGQWVDVKFEAAVECYSPESWACQPLPADGHAQLTAHWWESLSTHEEEGCSVWSGHYESRMAESAPFPISYFASSTSGEKKTAPRR
jgi:hypothetical protein